MSPPASPAKPLPAASLRAIEEVCERFEEHWLAGANPLLESALKPLAAEVQPQAFAELLRLEIAYRSLTERELAAYRARFPQFEAIVDAEFQAIAKHPLTQTSWTPHAGSDETRVIFAPLESGTKVDHYEIVGWLGRGAFAAVYRALNTKFHRLEALKISHDFQMSPEEQQRCREEARVLASLDHPRIVAVYDAGVWHGRYYLASRLVEGGALAARLKAAGGRLDPAVAVRIAIDVAEALAAAHALRIYHRDVKPQNILVDRSGRASLADFGVALSPSRFTLAEQFEGTPAYFSPEQARGEGGQVEGRSDLFSLGVVLYEMLTGKLPYRSEDAVGLMQEIEKVAPPPPRQLAPHIPPELEAICLRCLAKRPADRPASATELAIELQKVLALVSPAAAPASPVSPGCAVSVTIALGLFLMTSSFYWFNLQSSGPTPSPLPHLPISTDPPPVPVSVDLLHVESAEVHVQRDPEAKLIDSRMLVAAGQEQTVAPLSPLDADDRFVLLYRLSKPMPWALVHVDPSGGAAVVAQSKEPTQEVRVPAQTGRGVSFNRRDPRGENLLILLCGAAREPLSDSDLAARVASTRGAVRDLALRHLATRAGLDEHESAIQLPQDAIQDIRDRLPRGLTPLHALYLKTRD